MCTKKFFIWVFSRGPGTNMLFLILMEGILLVFLVFWAFWLVPIRTLDLNHFDVSDFAEIHFLLRLTGSLKIVLKEIGANEFLDIKLTAAIRHNPLISPKLFSNILKPPKKSNAKSVWFEIFFCPRNSIRKNQNFIFALNKSYIKTMEKVLLWPTAKSFLYWFWNDFLIKFFKGFGIALWKVNFFFQIFMLVENL